VPTLLCSMVLFVPKLLCSMYDDLKAIFFLLHDLPTLLEKLNFTYFPCEQSSSSNMQRKLLVKIHYGIVRYQDRIKSWCNIMKHKGKSNNKKGAINICSDLTLNRHQH
jgi:hypothetical protein